MKSTVQKLEVTYNPVNERNTFSNGDVITGQVTLETAKDCQLDTLYVKFKGKAEVLWTERHGNTTHVYHSKDKYFSNKQYFVKDKNLKDDQHLLLMSQNSIPYSSVVAPGVHIYPFSFQIPYHELPPSFKRTDGKIVYILETKLGRSMRMNKTESTTINFVPKADLNCVPGLMNPLHEAKDKKMKLFNSGSVAMDVNLEKAGFFQGEQMKITTMIKNDSTREIKPKYCIYRKHSFFAEGKRRVHTKDILKEVGAPIPPSVSEKVTQLITIPPDLEPSILNCSIIKAEYRLRVYLDVKYASDPEIKLEIVILPSPSDFTAAPPLAATGFGYEPFGNPNPPVWGFGPPEPPVGAQPFSAQPPPYGEYNLYPPLNDFGNK